MKRGNKQSIGMLGAVIGASIAMSFFRKNNSFNDLKQQAIDIWEEFKEKGDTLIKDVIPPEKID